MAEPKQPNSPQYELKQLVTFESERQLYCARISPCGNVLAAGGYDGKVHRWAITENKLDSLPVINGHNGWVTALAFAAEGKLLFTTDTWGQVRCQQYEGDAPKIVWQIDEAHDGWVRDIVVDAKRKAIITCGRDRWIRSLNTADGSATNLFQHDEDVFALALSSDGKQLAFGDWRGNVKLLDMESGKVAKSFDATVMYKLDRLQDVDGLRVLRFLDGGKTLLVAGCTPARGATMQGVPTMLLFEVASGKLIKKIEHGKPASGHIEDVAVNDEGLLIAGSSGVPGNGILFAMRAADDKPLIEETKVANLHAVALHPDGRRLIATGTNKGSNGNGRRVDKEGNYIGNTSPVVMFELAKADSVAAEPGTQPTKK